ncbi:MAG: SPW repeat protein [Pseudomonadota bacterium]|jgi:SPW repeat.|nr:MAG: hypothetical protein DIU56_13665 [Pseudomonadota bacterium]
MKRWQDWVNVVLGAWMVVSPWVLGFASTDSAAAWSAWILGAAVLISAGIAVYMPKAWEEAINIALGILLLVSPWVLGFAGETTQMSNAVIVGVLVAAFGIWAIVTDTAVREKWRERRGAH